MKRMLKQYGIPLNGLKKKQDYVQALLASGWVQEWDEETADAADVLPGDPGEIEIDTEAQTSTEEDVDRQQSNSESKCESQSASESESQSESEPESQSESESDAIDLEDRAFSSLAAYDSDFHNPIPNGWIVSEDDALPRLADRVLVF